MMRHDPIFTPEKIATPTPAYFVNRQVGPDLWAAINACLQLGRLAPLTPAEKGHSGRKNRDRDITRDCFRVIAIVPRTL
jgi:hypothetical protein